MKKRIFPILASSFILLYFLLVIFYQMDYLIHFISNISHYPARIIFIEFLYICSLIGPAALIIVGIVKLAINKSINFSVEYILFGLMVNLAYSIYVLVEYIIQGYSKNYINHDFSPTANLLIDIVCFVLFFIAVLSKQKTVTNRNKICATVGIGISIFSVFASVLLGNYISHEVLIFLPLLIGYAFSIVSIFVCKPINNNQTNNKKTEKVVEKAPEQVVETAPEQEKSEQESEDLSVASTLDSSSDDSFGGFSF